MINIPQDYYLWFGFNIGSNLPRAILVIKKYLYSFIIEVG